MSYYKKSIWADWMTLILTILLCVSVPGGAIALNIYIAKISCDNRWADSGMSHRYELIGGCMIQQPNGSWIPAANYRVAE